MHGETGLMTDGKSDNSTEIYDHAEAENKAAVGQDGPRMFSEELVAAYWRSNLGLLVKLLAIWAFVSFGCGVLMVDALNHIQVGGFKLGFWFAQQGSMYVFVVLIFVYVVRMKKIERAFGVDDD